MTLWDVVLVLFLLQPDIIFADIFLHNPRLFDSQNNNNGGYNVGNLYYYAGSKLSLEWTIQHSCGDANSHCQLIVQYMCNSHVRDGAVVNTIPVAPSDCRQSDCATDFQYGMHEEFSYFRTCALRQRNQNLFTADQDVAVMTNDAKRCAYYEAESENVKGRWACVVPPEVIQQGAAKGLTIPNNQADCQEFRWPPADPDGVKAEWKQFAPHGIATPVCQETQFTRDNHLGNGLGGHPNMFNWTLPELHEDRCVLRIRYNISTNDYADADASNNPLRRGRNTDVNLHRKYGFTNEAAASERGWVFKNNPQVQLFSDLPDFKLSLAINTAQFGRVFQDRSHIFAIRKRPEELKNARIHNLNVRGKRGNIVQVYPSVEYDFTPNVLEVMKEDYIHFQWTGSNKNPLRYDGEGMLGSDRSNVLLLTSHVYPGHSTTDMTQFGHLGRNYPAHLNKSSFLGLSYADRRTLAFLLPNQFGSQTALLDDSGTYFDLGPLKVTEVGSFDYMCTRNNQFSTRSQKGRIVSRDISFIEKSIGWNGGNISLPLWTCSVEVRQGDFDRLHLLRLEQWTPDQAQLRMMALNRKFAIDGDYASDFFVVQPETQLTVSGRVVRVKIKVSGSSVQMYSSNTQSFSTWTALDSRVTEGYASFVIDSGGIFIALSHPNTTGRTVGIVLGVLALLAVLGVAVWMYRRHHPDILSIVTRSLHRRV
ncbi:hypothetical protein NP493_340g02084 [Ridgeia piscesae]|uniref:Uncharacterized protein n=1 Tax=Ridgeia piscesae TaxID=27915 RepID=A0AAD9L3J2_RIDPI|nr:hypothetical protein NP493_340g02084 [Ridgeia piscesae]